MAQLDRRRGRSPPRAYAIDRPRDRRRSRSRESRYSAYPRPNMYCANLLLRAMEGRDIYSGHYPRKFKKKKKKHVGFSVRNVGKGKKRKKDILFSGLILSLMTTKKVCKKRKFHQISGPEGGGSRFVRVAIIYTPERRSKLGLFSRVLQKTQKVLDLSAYIFRLCPLRIEEIAYYVCIHIHIIPFKMNIWHKYIYKYYMNVCKHEKIVFNMRNCCFGFNGL